MTIDDSWYEIVDGQNLEQGDLIGQCPVYIPEYSTSIVEEPEAEKNLTYAITAKEYTYDVVIMTQSCDLGNGKVQSVVLCAYWSLDEMISQNEKLRPKKMQEKIRQGYLPNLYMLNKCTLKERAQGIQIIDFRMVFTVPHDFLRQFAGFQGKRLRLRSPYKEKMSQAFGSFFARVGLPKDIPSFA